MLDPGYLLLDRFRVDRLVGAGGMGFVYRAEELSTTRLVALKVLNDQAALTPNLVSRFHREARILSKMRHPHVIEVLEVAELPDGAPFYVMELLEGRDLRQELRARGTIPVEEATGYVIQAAGALDAVHRAGIVHRDLKPQNLFVTALTGARQIKLIDFGISKLTDDGESTLTATSGVLGTPHYMSPEQILASKAVDHRSDLWSLGVILYILLTGRLPFARGSVAAVIAAIPADPPDAFTDKDRHIPLRLREILLRCLAKDAAERFQSAEQVASALQEFAPGDGQIIAPEVNIPSTVPPVLVERRSSAAAAPPPARESTRPPALRSALVYPESSTLAFAIQPLELSTPDVLVRIASLEEETVPSSKRLAEARLLSTRPRAAQRTWLLPASLGALGAALLAGCIAYFRTDSTPARVSEPLVLPEVPIGNPIVSATKPTAELPAVTVEPAPASGATHPPKSNRPKAARTAATPTPPAKPVVGADGAPLHL